MSNFSIVEYFGEHEGYRCGYCKSQDTNHSHGMWAHELTVQDYQDLINRGWRRSGKYCYKPTMSLTCCPQYAIRLPVEDFKLSKSQKKILKRMHKYLAFGNKHGSTNSTPSDLATEGNAGPSHILEEHPKEMLEQVKQNPDDKKILQVSKTSVAKSCINENKERKLLTDPKVRRESFDKSSKVSPDKQKRDSFDDKVSGEPLRPPRKKAKLLRKERKLEKLRKKALEQGLPPPDPEQVFTSRKINQEGKSLEEFLSEPLPKDPTHTLEVKLIKLGPHSEFDQFFSLSHCLFKQYQMAIHKEPEKECDEDSYLEFLVNSPLYQEKEKRNGPIYGYGSFHQHYLLDGKLIAVGVIDILPNGLSSVYLYYDPTYSFLSLGTYAALREIAFTRELHKSCPQFLYYFMGFYIHSCPKMRYKGHFSPSYLLCPETYVWKPIELCIPKLEASKYSRLNEDPAAGDEDSEVNLNKVLILYKRQLMTYEVYSQVKKNSRSDSEQVKEYAKLVGRKCAYRMLLYRQ